MEVCKYVVCNKKSSQSRGTGISVQRTGDKQVWDIRVPAQYGLIPSHRDLEKGKLQGYCSQPVNFLPKRAEFPISGRDKFLMSAGK